jgi:hypothetical protein
MMPEQEVDILNPDVEVAIGGDKITVRELKWGDGRKFLRDLAGHVTALTNEKGEFDVSISRLSELIVQTDTLATFLISKTTGKDQAWIDALPMSSVLDLISTALELNLKRTLDHAKKIGGRFRAAAAVPAIEVPASEKPTISSSIKAMPAPTSTAPP